MVDASPLVDAGTTAAEEGGHDVVGVAFELGAQGGEVVRGQWPAQEVIGRSIYRLVPPDDPRLLASAIARSLKLTDDERAREARALSAEVHRSFSLKAMVESGVKFESKVVGGAVPKEYIPGVQKGIDSASQSGVIAGFPMTDMIVTYGGG